MHEKAKEHLKQLIRVKIGDSYVELDFRGDAFCVPEDSEKIEAAVAKHAGDYVGMAFYWTFILREALKRYVVPPRAGLVRELLNPIEINAIATEIADYIDTIPRDYTVYIPFDAPPGFNVDQIKIGDNFRIISKSSISAGNVRISVCEAV